MPKPSLVKWSWTEIKIEAGKAICVINLEILLENESSNHPFFRKMYPNAIIKTITTTLDTEVKNAATLSPPNLISLSLLN